MRHHPGTMPDADEPQDQAPTDDVLGNLPATRPGRRSTRREGSTSGRPSASAGPKRTTASASKAARPAGPAKPKRSAAPATPTSSAKTAADAPGADAPKRPTRGTRRVPAPVAPAPEQPPVPPAPRSGWATPDRDDAPPAGLAVGALVGEAAKQGEKLVGGVAKQGEKAVRGVLKRLGRR